MKWFDRLVEIEMKDNYLFEPPYPPGVRNPHARICAYLFMIPFTIGVLLFWGSIALEILRINGLI